MSIRKSIAANYVLSIIGTVVFIAGSMVINRILTPAEIGIFAIAQSVAMLLMAVQQLGINHYIVREQELSPEQLGSAAMLLGAQGLLLFLVLMGIAPLVAGFQDIPALRAIIQVLAATMLLWPVEMFSTAVLSRELKFATIAVGVLLRTAVNVGAGVYASILGYGAFGLAVAALLAIMVSASFFLQRAWPHIRLRWTLAHWRAPFHFGMVNMGLALARMGRTRGMEFMIGKLLGASAVGYFSRGSSLTDMAHTHLFFPLTRAFLPTVSRAKAGPRSGYIWSILRYNRLMLGIYQPFFTLLAIFSGPVIALLFGPQWEAAQPLLALLCVAQLVLCAHRAVDEVAMVEGRRRGLLITDLVRLVLLLAAALAVYRFGLIYVAALTVADAVLATVAYIAILRRLVGIPIGEIVRNNLQALAVAAVAAAPGLAYMQISGWPYRVPFGELALLGAASLGGWVLGLWLTRHELWSELERALKPTVARLGIGSG